MFFKKSHNDEPGELDRAMAELHKGSLDAFKILYEKYNRKVYRFCLRILEDQALAEDAFQETFIKVYEHRKDFRGENFQSWLFTIARHTCLNFIRAKKTHDSIDDDFQASYEISHTDFGMKDFIKNAVGKLPLALREALILREYEECSYQEIAEILSIDLSLAKVRVHRARLLLKKLLKPIEKEYYES